MLKPAILYADVLTELFQEYLYTEELFYYIGAPVNWVPEISVSDNKFQYAIVDEEDTVLGFLSYSIDLATSQVRDFGLFSFDPNNSIIGIDIGKKLKELINTYHRVAWQMVGGNPVKRHYDELCKYYNGNIMVLHDTTIDWNGCYRDSYYYEIINVNK